MLNCERQSITPWIDRYQALGVAGLYDEPRSGRPRHLDSDTIDEVEAALDDPPPDGDGSLVRWTLSRLRASFLAKASHVFGIETLRRRLHERGFRWKRPRLWAWGEDLESFEKLLSPRSPRAERKQGREPLRLKPRQQLHKVPLRGLHTLSRFPNNTPFPHSRLARRRARLKTWRAPT